MIQIPRQIRSAGYHCENAHIIVERGKARSGMRVGLLLWSKLSTPGMRVMHSPNKLPGGTLIGKSPVCTGNLFCFTWSRYTARTVFWLNCASKTFGNRATQAMWVNLGELAGMSCSALTTMTLVNKQASKFLCSSDISYVVAKLTDYLSNLAI